MYSNMSSLRVWRRSEASWFAGNGAFPNVRFDLSLPSLTRAEFTFWHEFTARCLPHSAFKPHSQNSRNSTSSLPLNCGSVSVPFAMFGERRNRPFRLWAYASLLVCGWAIVSHSRLSHLQLLWSLAWQQAFQFPPNLAKNHKDECTA